MSRCKALGTYDTLPLFMEDAHDIQTAGTRKR